MYRVSRLLEQDIAKEHDQKERFILVHGKVRFQNVPIRLRGTVADAGIFGRCAGQQHWAQTQPEVGTAILYSRVPILESSLVELIASFSLRCVVVGSPNCKSTSKMTISLPAMALKCAAS